MQCIGRAAGRSVLISQHAVACMTWRHCSSRAREMLPQIASLADTRAVLRLSGQELVAFLQVCPSLSPLKIRPLGRFDHTLRMPDHNLHMFCRGY